MSDNSRNSLLILPQCEVDLRLKERIQLGLALINETINSQEEFEKIKTEEGKWNSFNIEYLKHCFNTNTIANEYYNAISKDIYSRSLEQEIAFFRKRVQRLISILESICERLFLFKEEKHNRTTSQIRNMDEIFIAHGHDESIKHEVARFIEKLGLTSIILDERPNLGGTIIDKFEAHAKSAAYAIILLTPDDIGHAKNHPAHAKFRARQNVILELGYFIGSLGRKNVFVLHLNEVEIPSDYHGVIYIPENGWKFLLAREMKAAGIPIDLNKLTA